MKQAILAVVAGFVMCGTTVNGAYQNITIPDTIAGGSRAWWQNVNEDNEVEPGCLDRQRWDMEAFLFDAATHRLQMQGGYNMVLGENDGGSTWFYSGDIFIDVNGDAAWGATLINDASPDANGYHVVGNGNFGWDYVINFGRSGGPAGGVLDGSYKVFALTGASVVEVFYDVNNKSNPLRYSTGGIELANAGGNVTQIMANPAGAQGLNGEQTHYVLGDIDLSFLTGQTPGDITFHYTMGCGNDLLMGRTPSWQVPDGGLTVALLGGSLSALVLISRRMRKD